MPLVPTDDITGLTSQAGAPITPVPAALHPTDSEPTDSEPASAEADVNPTADTQSLQPLGDEALPVFLDITGRRRRHVRALLWLVSLAGLTYATVLVLSLLSGHDSQALAVPDFRPGDRSPAATGAPVASIQVEIHRTGDPAAAGPRPGATATTGAQVAPIGAPVAKPETSHRPAAPSPRRSSPTATEASPTAPSTPAASASPTSGGLVDGLLDTVLP